MGLALTFLQRRVETCVVGWSSLSGRTAPRRGVWLVALTRCGSQEPNVVPSSESTVSCSLALNMSSSVTFSYSKVKTVKIFIPAVLQEFFFFF